MDQPKDDAIDLSWVDEIIAKLSAATDGILKIQIGDQTLEAYLGQEAIQFFKDNKAMLIRVGLDTFAQFLQLLSEKKNEQAFLVLLNKMDADDIIARMNMNADELKQRNDLHDQFIHALEIFFLHVLEGVAVKVLAAFVVTLI